VTAKKVRKEVAAKLQRDPQSIKQDVNYAINKYAEDYGFGGKEDDANAEAAAAPGASSLLQPSAAPSAWGWGAQSLHSVSALCLWGGRARQ